MALYLLEERHGPEFAYKIAREMVVYIRRELAALIYTSPRNLTRLFKATAGVTIGQYLEKLRVEKALHLLRDRVKIGTIPRQCGLQSANQLRNMLRKYTGKLPSQLG